LYLLNGRCEHLAFEEPRTRARFYSDLEWVAEDVRADGVVVADVRVAKLIRARYSTSSLPIRVSTIAGVLTPRDLEPWVPLGIDGVVLHHDTGRDFERLAALVSFLHQTSPESEVELLVNESCLPRCPARDAHYARLARESLNYVEGFQQNCNIPRFLDPSLVLAARWIRPEDIEFYRSLGIRRFKIAGREMPQAWLDRAVYAYLSGTYGGNLVDLFTMTPPGLNVAAADIVFLNNPDLKGFLPGLREWRGRDREFYREWAHHLWDKGAFRIEDPHAEYNNTGLWPKCQKPGEQLRRLMQLQEFSDPAFRHGARRGHHLVQILPARGKQHQEQML
jgi:hypothetical protein